MRGQLIFVRKLAQNAAGIAYCDTVRRDIPRHHRACADDTARADGYATAKGYVAAYPSIIPYRDCARAFKVGNTARFFVKKSVSVLIAQGMNRSQKGYVRTDKYRAADGHLSLVQHNEVKVCIAPLAKGGVCAKIEINRALQVHPLAAVGKKLIEDFFTLFRVRFVRFVVQTAELMRLCALLGHSLAKRVVNPPRKHFLTFGHRNFLSR